MLLALIASALFGQLLLNFFAIDMMVMGLRLSFPGIL